MDKNHIYLAQYGIVIGNAQGDITEFEIEEITAMSDESAIKIAENRRLVLDAIEKSKPKSPGIAREVKLVNIRKQSNKNIIYFCGRTEGNF